MKIKLSKNKWQSIGKQTGWLKTAQIIPDDGFADGGESYTNEEMAIMDAENYTPSPNEKVVVFTQTNHPDLPFAIARDAQTAFDLWKEKRWDFEINGQKFSKDDWRGREAIEKLFGESITIKPASSSNDINKQAQGRMNRDYEESTPTTGKVTKPIDPLTSHYRKAEIESILEPQTKYAYRMKFWNGESGASTKHMNLSKEELLKILSILS